VRQGVGSGYSGFVYAEQSSGDGAYRGIQGLWSLRGSRKILRLEVDGL
jgi:hypothetical protein